MLAKWMERPRTERLQIALGVAGGGIGALVALASDEPLRLLYLFVFGGLGLAVAQAIAQVRGE
jgi:hypothetical protein